MKMIETEKPKLIVMLTYKDKTVGNAYRIFEECKDSKASFFGCKEEPLPLDEMKRLFAYMKACGKRTFLEVVAYTEKEGMEGARKAADCGVDVLLGTIYSDAIRELCRAHHILYMPFVGNISGRPSVLKGSIDEMIREANKLAEKGVAGIDLLAYRYTGDADTLIGRFVREVQVPVCIAGSINSYERLDKMKEVRPWSFTIGGAFFEGRFSGTMKEQINTVCEYMEDAESGRKAETCS